MLTLKIYRSKEDITFSTVDNRGKLGELTEKGGVAWGYVNIVRREIGLNLDMFKDHYWRYLLPQIITHEILHFLFHSFEVTNIIHTIHDRSRGLII